MSIDELESEAMKLNPSARAKLAGKLLESLDNLSEADSDEVWAREAARRKADWDANPDHGRPADDVIRDARSKLS